MSNAPLYVTMGSRAHRVPLTDAPWCLPVRNQIRHYQPGLGIADFSCSYVFHGITGCSSFLSWNFDVLSLSQSVVNRQTFSEANSCL